MIQTEEDLATGVTCPIVRVLSGRQPDTVRTLPVIRVTNTMIITYDALRSRQRRFRRNHGVFTAQGEEMGYRGWHTHIIPQDIAALETFLYGARLWNSGWKKEQTR